MASNKVRHQKTLSDEGPIVFPVPTSNPSDVFPPDFKQPNDLVVDPYGNFYCFVCRVSVPKGDSNVSQHLSGKKHDTHNKRFSSEHQKDSVRQRVLQAALQQRIARGVPLFTADAAASPANNSSSVQTPLVPPVPVTISAQLNPPQNAPAQTDPPSQPVSSLPRSPEKKTRKAKRLAEAKRMRAIQIDKQAFLSQILADVDDTSSESDSQLQNTNAFDLSQRQKPFGPLELDPTEQTDSFFESMPEETTPSDAAAKVRDTLANKHKILGKDWQPTVVQPKRLKDDHDAEEFLSFDDIGKDQEELEEEQRREEARRKARESLIILKDESGEELPPWLLDSEATEKVLYSSDSSVSLHYEILEFCQFVSPTQAELDSRNVLIMTVESIVKQLWPASTIEVFGSYATGLYLPSSDVDVCVLGTPCGGELKEIEQLAAAIRNVTWFARRVRVIKATVNLVKIISRKASMNCDISIGVANGPKYVPVIRGYLESYPALRPLLLVIKCFLRQRDLNEVYVGGLGSYSVLLLVVSHLQMLKYNFPSSRTNLGALLQQFFQLYGRMHNLCLAGIQVKDNGCYYDKFERYQTCPKDVLRLSIEDPNNVTNELGRNGFAVSRVRKAFANASKTLVDWRRHHSSVPPTPLSAILQPDELFRFRRTAVIDDLESKGKKPLRESLDPLNKRLVRSEGTAHAPHGLNTSATTTRHTSPDRRRERDPRLAKRRRTGTGNDLQTNAYGSGGDPRDAANHRTRSESSHTNANNANSYQNVSKVAGNAMFNQTMTYSGQNNFNQQAYSPATPGYQYVGNPMFMGSSMRATFPAQNFMPMPQQMVPQQAMGNSRGMGNAESTGHGRNQYFRGHDNGSIHRGRGRPMKRGYRPRRGNNRGRQQREGEWE